MAMLGSRLMVIFFVVQLLTPAVVTSSLGIGLLSVLKDEEGVPRLHVGLPMAVLAGAVLVVSERDDPLVL